MCYRVNDQARTLAYLAPCNVAGVCPHFLGGTAGNLLTPLGSH